MIVLITPTGGRPEQFANCVKWMKNQTYEKSVFWIIVDDCVPTTTTFDRWSLGCYWNVYHMYPTPAWKVGMNTQGRNLKQALQLVKQLPVAEVKGIFIIEDDDYYSPDYLQVMTEKLEGFDAAGTVKTMYYNIPRKCYYRNNNVNHSSLFQIAFKPNVIDILEDSCEDKFIDIKFCHNLKNLNLFASEKDLSVGIKGLPGRAGIGIGHRTNASYLPDPDLEQLKHLLGEDYKHYNF